MSNVANYNVAISIIISSYNYEKFVGAAIDSALALDWPNTEVIVVDDGSTDRSPSIIQAYSHRITAIFQSNLGRVQACNNGFKQARGDIILFLDSDDMLHPSLVKEVVRVWTPHVSKIQCQMLVVDADGEATGQAIPAFMSNLTSKKIRDWSSTTGGYPTPFGSGNAYTKSFLDKIFPLDSSVWDSTDSCCLAAAPYFGAVETINKPLVYYRIHGRNASRMTESDQGTILDVHIPRAVIIDTLRRFSYTRFCASQNDIIIAETAIKRNLAYAASRIVSYRLHPKEHPVESDNLCKILFDGVCASLTPQGLAVRSCFVQLLFIFAVGLVPMRFAPTLVLWRYVPKSRPHSVRNFSHAFFACWSTSSSQVRPSLLGRTRRWNDDAGTTTLGAKMAARGGVDGVNGP